MPNASPKVRAYIEKNRGRGRIYLFDFNNPEKNIEELKFIGETFDPSDFAPHGISVRTSKTGIYYLFFQCFQILLLFFSFFLIVEFI